MVQPERQNPLIVLRSAKDKIDYAVEILVERTEAQAAEYQPGRWWQVLAPDDSVWCGTSDEEEARESMRPGDRIQREYVLTRHEWRDA